MTTTIKLNAQQEKAVALAVQWYKDYKKGITTKKYFFLSGVAGTGKTFIAKYIAELCCGLKNSIFIAPTGKAASRLRQKGCRNAQTMHRFIYNFKGENSDGDLIFSDKNELESQPDLIVLDEGSMVGLYDANNIFSYKIPVLVLGDVDQVPPVRDKPFFTKNNMDCKLTQIERQKENSNIIRASIVIREGFSLPIREYDDVAIRAGRPTSKLLKEYAAEDAQIICSRNATRHSYNNLIRGLLGHVGGMPSIGEKLVCMFNQHKYDFMNGEQCILKSLETLPYSDTNDNDLPAIMMANVFSLTDNKMIRVKFNPDSFSPDITVRTEALKHAGGFDFGYVMTVHKSQGSEWPKVMILEEVLSQVPYRLMMYTAITRAMEKLIIYLNP
jgi:exodeoxyribonuclease-5